MDSKELVFAAIVAMNNRRTVKQMTDAMIAQESGVAIADVPTCLKTLMTEGRIRKLRIELSKRRRQFYYAPVEISEEATS